MPYGTVKVDNVTFTNNSVDATTTFSGIYASITNNLTLSGTATAATFTGTTANFTNVNAQNISVTTSLSGLAITGGTAGFTTITGTTVTGTTANFATVSGTTVTGTTARFITITGGAAGFTTITGTTVTGTTANFVTVSGTTVTGTTASFTSGIFTSLSGTTHTITSGVFASGTAALPSISFVSDPNTGIYSPGADQVAVATNGSGRLFINSAGQVGIGATSPTDALQVANGNILIGTGGSSAGYRALYFGSSSTASARFAYIEKNNDSPYDLNIVAQTSTSATSAINFKTTPINTAATIDSSGRLLVGTSTARSNFFNTASSATPQLQVEGTTGNTCSLSSICSVADTSGGRLLLAHQRSGAVGGNTILNSGDEIGTITFQGNDGGQFVESASISAQVDGAPGADDMPGRLVFSTTADGASSPTERMRISSAGSLFVGKTERVYGNTGLEVRPIGDSHWTSDNIPILAFNRLTSDGTLIEFGQASVVEGNISVSGTTVSYNGAHLSRWSQLPSGAERTEILRGTVLSNIDEMCEWDEEDNEQLNRMKVSDVEGDKNVSGVFQCWDDDDDTYTDDFYCAMTGDFIIRIAEGVTIERGDLLMSAGDGTAKPQDDDIIRSKTIAKVTSTSVSCTYEDGSYCVPCVLMAC